MVGTKEEDDLDPDAAARRSAPTPATVELWSCARRQDWDGVADLLAAHWAELWYAVDPADLRSLLSATPAELWRGSAEARYLARAVGLEPGDDHEPASSTRTTPPSLQARLNRSAQHLAELRLAGRPAAALAYVEAASDDVRTARGFLLDASGGAFAMWAVQAGITALLAGRLSVARGYFSDAAAAHRPDRFPFVRREAAAKLALTHAVGGNLDDAASWARRARELAPTASWVEALIDDTLWLTDYIGAVTTLELDRAEELRATRPSPLAHLEFWVLALPVYVEHLVLTRRFADAVAVCDEVAAVGFPLPESDGGLEHAVADARALILAAQGAPVTASGLGVLGGLARRQHLYRTGQFEQLTDRTVEDLESRGDARVRLITRLLRAQSLVRVGDPAVGRGVLLNVLDEVFRLRLLAVLRHADPELLSEIDDERAVRACDLIGRHHLPTPHVAPLLGGPLSPAEVEVLKLLSLGLSRKQIAETLFVSINTVKTHLASAYTKLGVRDRQAALDRLEQLEL